MAKTKKVESTFRKKSNKKRKKTRQGRSHNTKLKNGQKRYRGQGR